MKIAEYITLPG